MKILVVEDKLALAQSIISYLNSEGYTCHLATDAYEFEDFFSKHQYQFFILDVMLPFGDGLSLLKHIKTADADAPVMMISAKDAHDDRAKALALGADGFLTKPFHLSTLSTQIREILLQKSPRTALLKYKEIELNNLEKSVKILGVELDLTFTEFALLRFLMLNPNKVISKNAVIENLNAQTALYFNNFEIVAAHLHQLRQKMGTAGKYVQTVYGIGFKLS
ncbi:hypothetical protein BCY91_04325 [Pelobium manganitolerans]|uniref:DNA-binding response regulator n=1 Tax=Pelobium manganitolerans TaxID=1842495 RepID=A0A419S5J2_9SPHI|nr:response regulator transcription factor [Pelobium manganitolerans]RKD16121.1 hypothetical protein BCY91_04325 [Pelobium manganitolerans]